jgi:uncharacterized protein (TIGR00369 family)
MLAQGVSFFRVGLLGPTLRRMARVKPRFPACPELGREVPLPWSALAEHRCFVCSPRNDRGLKLAFHEAEGFELACAFRPSDVLENYPGMLHGGIAVTVLDELVGQAIFKHAGHLPVSVEANVRWHKPVKIGEACVAATQITATYERVYAASSWLFRSDGKVAAELTGQYYTPTLPQFRKMAELETVLPVAHGWFAPSRAKKESRRAS